VDTLLRDREQPTIAVTSVSQSFFHCFRSHKVVEERRATHLAAARLLAKKKVPQESKKKHTISPVVAFVVSALFKL